MVSELERFGKDVSANEALRNSVKALGSTDPADVVKFANGKGYAFTLDEVNSVANGGELLDSQLENVTGGLTFVVGGDKGGYVASGTAAGGKGTFMFVNF